MVVTLTQSIHFTTMWLLVRLLPSDCTAAVVVVVGGGL